MRGDGERASRVSQGHLAGVKAAKPQGSDVRIARSGKATSPKGAAWVGNFTRRLVLNEVAQKANYVTGIFLITGNARRQF